MRRKQKGDKFEALKSHPNVAFLLLPPKPALTFNIITIFTENYYISFEVENFCGRMEGEPFPYPTFEVRTNRASGKALGKHDLG